MGDLHDNLSTHYGDLILEQIRSAKPDFKQIFSTHLVRSADWSWPRPDYVCVDEDLKCSYALEFKPPKQSKREYLTGLGQALSYLQKHMYAGLIVPEVSVDDFPIADFIRDTLMSDELKNISISLYSYRSFHEVSLLKPIAQKRIVRLKPIDFNEIQTFWCWWRDCSQYELFDLLNYSFLYNEQDGDIYTDFIYPAFYERLTTKQTKTWEGIPRNKTRNSKSYASEKQNYKIPLSQLELWNNGNCKLTDLGLKMLEIGKKYGPNSDAFMNALTYLILVNGKHLELIKMFEAYQKEHKIEDRATEFLLSMENHLAAKGCIGKRKPGEITTNAKATYIRDEPKLWNKLGIMQICHANQLFHPTEGYKFNWHKIADALVKGSGLLGSFRK